MIKISQKFYERTFSDKDAKSAYMRAVKWTATNIIAKDEMKNVHIEFIKFVDKSSLPSISVCLYAVLDNEEEVFSQHCRCCEEMHHSFFVNENNNCNICAAKGYQNRMEKHIRMKVSYYKELLKKEGII